MCTSPQSFLFFARARTEEISSPVAYLVLWLGLLPQWTPVVLPKLLAGDSWILLYLSHENLLAVTPCFVLFPWPTGQDLGQPTVSCLPPIQSCKEYAQAVHTQRTLGWQLTLSLGLVDTEFPMVKAPTEAKTFLLSVFVISSMALSIFEVRSLTEKTAWCSNKDWTNNQGLDWVSFFSVSPRAHFPLYTLLIPVHTGLLGPELHQGPKLGDSSFFSIDFWPTSLHLDLTLWAISSLLGVSSRLYEPQSRGSKWAPFSAGLGLSA